MEQKIVKINRNSGPITFTVENAKWGPVAPIATMWCMRADQVWWSDDDGDYHLDTINNLRKRRNEIGVGKS